MTAKVLGYMQPDIDPNTRLYVPFNEGVGDVAKDYSQYGNHAQLTDVEWSNEGFNGAGKFNGSSSYGDCGNDVSLNITAVISIDATVKANVLQLDKGIVVVDSRQGFWQYQSTKIRGWIRKGDHSDFVIVVSSADLIEINEWYQIVQIFDGNNLRLYANGNNVGTTSYVGTMYEIGGTRWTIGAFSAVAQYFNGTINNVIISSTAKSAAQIAADCYEVVCN